MCESCRSMEIPSTLTIIDPELQPKKAKEAKRRGGRYVFASGFSDPNMKDILTTVGHAPTWSIPADAWDRIFGEK